jgi:hypothetical protein
MACFQGNMKLYPIGVWLKEGDYRDALCKGQRVINNNLRYGTKYPYGFHIFKTKYAAEKRPTYAVRKVLYRKAVASGLQDNCITIVAKEMKILP